MGIPKFFRWMSERYPGLLTTARESQLPDIDNFYLDMNGIIHNCSHPCDGDVHFRISENEMHEDIFNYVTTLFKIMKPKKYFFMAVDGVAPRAKMNQQRGRRFRTAKEANDREGAALEKGDILPEEQRFDSNCITPGTDFMVRLNKALIDFVSRKVATDPDWRRVKVILSGHETPGEGEHKVMDFIRHQRSQDGYDPETRHCLYGLDTDLIMLGLSCHEPNFWLLREEVKFNNKRSEATKGKSQRVDPSKITFNVLSIGLLRDNIQRDFMPLKPQLAFKFDLEAIIDDWILFCFLIGNDFIPHIPHFHIHKNSLPKIFDAYQSTLVKLDGYINEKGVLNLSRFRTFCKALADVDLENYKALLKENGGECAKDDFSKLNEFVKHRARVAGIGPTNSRPQRRFTNPSHHSHSHHADVWYKIKNQGNKFDNAISSTPRRSYHSQSAKPSPSFFKQHNGSTNGRTGVHSFTEEQINNSITVCADGDFIDVSDDEFQSDERFPDEMSRKNHRSRNQTQTNNRSSPKKGFEARNKLPPSKSNDLQDFHAYKQTYYREKLKLNPPSEEAIMQVVREYVRALQWNLHYYYHGCISWGWFYPYHYAPFISDVMNFRDVDMNFELGEPFKPFDQLLSVLPAASHSLLPYTYRHLVLSPSSPLAPYFPSEVEYDLNGKQNDWEAVVLAPFIDQERLLRASQLFNLFLSPKEASNNVHGPHLMFYYDPDNKHTRGQHTRGDGTVCLRIDKNGFHVPRDQIKYGILAVKKPGRNGYVKQEFNYNSNNHRDQRESHGHTEHHDRRDQSHRDQREHRSNYNEHRDNRDRFDDRKHREKREHRNNRESRNIAEQRDYRAQGQRRSTRIS